MRICFLSPLVPSVAYGHRPHSFLRYLRTQGHHITLHCINDPGPVPDAGDRLRNMGIDVRPVNIPRPVRWLSCLVGFPGSRPLRVCHCRSRRLLRVLLEDLKRTPYDVLHIDRFRMAEYGLLARKVFRGTIFVDFPDALSLYYERAIQVPHAPLMRLIDHREAKVIPPYEKRVVNWGFSSIVCSEVDRNRLLESCPGSVVEVVPNMVDVDEFAPRLRENASPKGTFSGTLYYFPNIDALRWFHSEVFPRIGIPDFSVNVLGFGATSELDEVRKDPRFHFHGYVKNMAEHLYADDLYLCPLRVGAGVRFKLLEAFSAGMAVVSTTLGYEGIPCIPGEHLLVADSAEEFASAIRYLIAHPEEKRRLGSNARRFVQESYSIEAAGKKLESIYEKNLREEIRTLQ